MEWGCLGLPVFNFHHLVRNEGMINKSICHQHKCFETLCVKGSSYVPDHGTWANLVNWKKMAKIKCPGVITMLDDIGRGRWGRISLQRPWRWASAPPGTHDLCYLGMCFSTAVFSVLVHHGWGVITQCFWWRYLNRVQSYWAHFLTCGVGFCMYWLQLSSSLLPPLCFLSFPSWPISSVMCKLGFLKHSNHVVLSWFCQTHW